MPSTPQDRKTKRTATKTAKTTKPASYGSGWKTPLTDLQLPSGEMCQVKRSGVQGMMKEGVLDSVDSLTAIVQGDTIPKAQGKRQIDVKSVMADKDAMTKILAMVDRIVIFSVVQPQVHSNYVTKDQAADADSPFFGEDIDEETGLGRFIEFSERDADKVYVDYIDEVDRMFIMNFVVGGSSDLERFREETAALMGGVSAGEAAENATE